MGDKDNIAKDVTTVAQLQEQLQLSAREGGISVVDAYSTKWGFCRAIAPTFRRLFLEADEATKLRFITADVTQILADYDKAEAAGGAHAKAGKKELAETTPEFWVPLLRKHEGKAKPAFFFFKEGKLVKSIEGCATPQIINLLKDMTTVKTPADEFIQNPTLLEFWGENFNASDSEVPLDRFQQALNSVCKLTVPLNDAELTLLKETLHIKPAQILVVHAESLQKWVGDGTLMQAFTSTFPLYEERAIQARKFRELEQQEQGARAGLALEGVVELEAEVRVGQEQGLNWEAVGVLRDEVWAQQEVEFQTMTTTTTTTTEAADAADPAATEPAQKE
eukprot:RCo048940